MQENAKVEIREEFTILTPGGGSMFANAMGTLYPKTCKYQNEKTVKFSVEGQATLEAEKLNQALRDNGIDASYKIAKRTITTVTSDWEEM